MKQQIIILYAKDFDIPPENGRSGVRGTSVMYYFADAFKATEGNPDGSKGLRPAKASIDYYQMSNIKKAPALYEAEMGFKVGSDLKPVMAIQDLTYISDLSMLTEDGEAVGA